VRRILCQLFQPHCHLAGGFDNQNILRVHSPRGMVSTTTRTLTFDKLALVEIV
jgi:hypothetical protein